MNFNEKTFRPIKSVLVRCADFKEGHYYKFRSFFHNRVGLGRVWVKIVDGRRRYFYQNWMGNVTPWVAWEKTMFVEVFKCTTY